MMFFFACLTIDSIMYKMSFKIFSYSQQCLTVTIMTLLHSHFIKNGLAPVSNIGFVPFYATTF